MERSSFTDDDDGDRRIRVLFNDPIHKEEIVGNKKIISQVDETKVGNFTNLLMLYIQTFFAFKIFFVTTYA